MCAWMQHDTSSKFSLTGRQRSWSNVSVHSRSSAQTVRRHQAVSRDFRRKTRLPFEALACSVPHADHGMSCALLCVASEVCAVLVHCVVDLTVLPFEIGRYLVFCPLCVLVRDSAEVVLFSDGSEGDGHGAAGLVTRASDVRSCIRTLKLCPLLTALVCWCLFKLLWSMVTTHRGHNSQGAARPSIIHGADKSQGPATAINKHSRVESRGPSERSQCPPGHESQGPL